MIFLPVAERELRVASRKRSTFWVRIAGALVALVIGGGCFVLTLFGGFGFGTAALGTGLFAVLTYLCLGVALSAGLFFTSDCLSEEKREGTLGFLFLTDLRGYDVVFGKLLATSLRGSYAMLAVLPILAITLLMGGVTGAEFWKTILALINALFLSLAAGLFVSAISRDSQKALAATLLLLLLLVAGGPMVDATIAGVRRRPFQPVLSRSSPIYLFRSADAWGATPFWSSLLANQVAGWVLFGLTCHLIPRTWKDQTSKSLTPGGGGAARWRFGSMKSRAAHRRKLVNVNPALWLACRERWQAVVLWSLVILLLGGFTAILVSNGSPTLWMVWGYFGGAFTLILYLGVASQAGRFFVEAKRNGLLELLLATPLTARRIVQGQWRGLVRMFGLPLLLCLAAQMLGTFLYYRAWSNMAATMVAAMPAAAAAAATTNSIGGTNLIMATTNVAAVTITTTVRGPMTVSGAGSDVPNLMMALSIALTAALAIAGNLVALIWFGMWMGLNSKSSSSSTLKTIAFVQVIPWFIVSFASALVVPLLLLPRFTSGSSTGPSQIMAWYPMITSLVATVLYLAKDIGFTLWARQKLYSEFREGASRAGPSTSSMRPPASPQTEAPPVITVP